jgi:D-arabinose 1-dehydrogenase-like Zn-dependent alcohol dehydrogenase
MPDMKAAVVTNFEEPPHYMEFLTPEPVGPDQVLVEVLAAGLHPRVRSGAGGAH